LRSKLPDEGVAGLPADVGYLHHDAARELTLDDEGSVGMAMSGFGPWYRAI
jgi:hypothetical protein